VALKEHQAILTALEARDPIAAQAAMRAHLKASAMRWVGE
jgi:GntR family transcriptional repressor for pyruvate dehydrogenase complex